MSATRKRGHCKNLSQQAIDLIAYYNNVKTTIQQEQTHHALIKKRSMYCSDFPILEEELEESPQNTDRHISRTQHVDVNIYREVDIQYDLHDDVKQLKQNLSQRIAELKKIIDKVDSRKSIVVNTSKTQSFNRKQSANKENQCINRANIKHRQH